MPSKRRVSEKLREKLPRIKKSRRGILTIMNKFIQMEKIRKILNSYDVLQNDYFKFNNSLILSIVINFAFVNIFIFSIKHFAFLYF